MGTVFKVVVLYDEAPDAESYAAHVEVCHRVPGGTFRHGPVIGSPMGHAAHAYWAEWEFPDRASLDAATTSDEFVATGRDARDRGLPPPSAVEYLELG